MSGRVGSGGGGGWGRVGGQGGCEIRIEVFVKMQKKKSGGVRSGQGLGDRGVGFGRGGGGWLVAMLGVRGDVGYWGCEPRIEGNVQCTKKVLYNIKKIKKKIWGRGGAIFEPKTPSMY